MNRTAEFSTRHAQAKRSQAQKRSDREAGTLLGLESSSGTLAPVGTSEWWAGELWIYEATDEEFVADGVITAGDLPGPAAGCKVKRRAGSDLLKTYRMADGRVRLTISAHLVRRRDAAFVDFLARTVSRGVLAQV